MSRRTDKGPSIVVRCPRLQVHHTPAMKPGIQRKRAPPQQGKGDEHTQVYSPDLRWWQPQHRKECQPRTILLGSSGWALLRLQPPRCEDHPGVVQNWWRQGMAGGAKAHYDGIKAFSETDFTEDLKSVTVPAFVMHGDDDQVVPIGNSAPLSAKLLKNAKLKIYPGYPHGMCMTHADVVNADLLAFIKS